MQQVRLRIVRALWQHMTVRASCADRFISSVGLQSLESSFAASSYASIRSFARHRRVAQTRGKEPASTSADFDTEMATLEEALPEQDMPDKDHSPSSEQMWPTSRFQKKYSTRVRDALHTVMVSGSRAYERLVWQLGFTVVEVRMSPDNMTAFILWDAHDDCLSSAEREVSHRLSQLRRDMGRILGMRRTPRLEFRLDRLTPEQQAVEAAFERLRTID